MNLRVLYSPLVYKIIPWYFIFVIIIEFIFFKINDIKGDDILSQLNLFIIIISIFVLVLIYLDFGKINLRNKRDCLLFLLTIIGATGLIIFFYNYSLSSILVLTLPSLIVLWYLSSPFTTDWANDKLSDQEIYNSFVFNKRYLPVIEKYVIHIVLLFICSIVIVPLLWILDTALSPGNSLSSSSSFNFMEWSAEHFDTIINSEEFYIWLRNSVVVSVGTTVFGIFLAIPAGYAFSRFNFNGKGTIMFSFLLVQMFPGVIIIVPYFILMKTLGLLNTSIGLVLAYSVTALPLCVWMLKGYFDTIPRELEEAARVDGCSQLQIFWKIMIPLSLPAIAVTSLFSFLAAWNEFLLALTFNTSNENYTLPVGLASFISPTKQAWGDFAALSIIASIPVVFLFIFFQKYLINGLTAGSIKG